MTAPSDANTSEEDKFPVLTRIIAFLFVIAVAKFFFTLIVRRPIQNHISPDGLHNVLVSQLSPDDLSRLQSAVHAPLEKQAKVESALVHLSSEQGYLTFGVNLPVGTKVFAYVARGTRMGPDSHLFYAKVPNDQIVTIGPLPWQIHQYPAVKIVMIDRPSSQDERVRRILDRLDTIDPSTRVANWPSGWPHSCKLFFETEIKI